MVLKSKIIKKINPRDDELLKKLKIKKEYFPETNEIFYIVLLNNNEIGSAVYRTNTNVVDSTGIDKEYRRKGINTWLYDYIEKDQKIKLIPSNTLMREGMLFWRNRLKRKNPTDEEFLKKIRIEKTKFRPFDKTEDLYQIIYDNKNIGYALYDPISRTIEDISVQEEFRQKGIATLLHDYIEKDLRIILKPNSTQTWYGKAFWENRLKKTSNPKNKNARTLKTSKTKISR